MQIRNRIMEQRLVHPDEVAPNPRNWRTHPQHQRDALRGVLAEVGIVAPVIAYHSERAGGRLMLVDGHERMTVGVPFPAVILDVSDSEADKLLATFDPITSLATANVEALEELVGSFELESQATNLMLTSLLHQHGTIELPPVDVNELWKGMPDFENEEMKPYKVLKVHFERREDYETFARLINQTLTEKTKAIWYPYKAPDDVSKYRVQTEDGEEEDEE